MGKPFSLEERTLLFAKTVRELVYQLKSSVSNYEDGKQVTRSSGSIAANYIEANENLSDKDFVYRIKVCCKEAKETELWLKLLNNNFNKEFKEKIEALEKEANELKRIFISIINKKNNNHR